MGCCRECDERETIGGVDGGECDQSFAFPWPSDVDRLKARIALSAESFDLGVKSCATLAPEDRASWEMFITEFRSFAKRETPLFGAYQEWVTACSYSHTFDGWRRKLNEQCKSVPGPHEIHGVDASALKWIAAATIAAVLGIVVLTKVPALRP